MKTLIRVIGVISVIGMQCISFGTKVFEANFDNSFDAVSPQGKIKAYVEGQGIVLTEKGAGLPIRPESRALDQQNVAKRTERSGWICYPTDNLIKYDCGSITLWVNRRGGGTYNTFLCIGNALWDKSYCINLFYDAPQKRLFFRYRRGIGESLDAILPGRMEENVWYLIVANWRYDYTYKEMKLTLCRYKVGGKVESKTSSAKWIDVGEKWSRLFGAKAKIWIGSSKDGYTPANSLIDEVKIYNHYVDISKIIDSIRLLKSSSCKIKSAELQPNVILTSDTLKTKSLFLPIGKMNSFPKIDGKLNENELKKLIALKSGFLLSSILPADNPTKVWIGHIGAKLYIAIRAFYNADSNLICSVADRDGPVWTDDCVEIYIQPNPSVDVYYHWCINSIGAVYDEKKKDAKWNGKADVAVSKYDEYWDIEFAIDLSAILPEVSKVIRLNVTRNDRSVIPAQLSSIVPIEGNSFHNSKTWLWCKLVDSEIAIDASLGYLPGGPGMSGFELNIKLIPLERNNVEAYSIIWSAKTKKLIDRQKVQVRRNTFTFNHYIPLADPLINQLVLSKDGRIIVNILQPIFQDKVRMVSNDIPARSKPQRACWLDNKLGCDEDIVPAPWKPIEFVDRTVKVIGREYTFPDNSIIGAIKINGHQVLAEPIKLKAQINNKAKEVTIANFQIVNRTPSSIKIIRDVKIDDNISGKLHCRVEFDGYVWFTLELSGRKALCNKLYLTSRLNAKLIPYIIISGSVNEAENKQVKFISPGFRLNLRFIPYFWLGNDDFGICFFSDSDRDWRISNLRRAIEFYADNSILNVRVNFISKPTRLDKKMVYRFGLQGTPVKPVKSVVDRDMAIVNVHRLEMFYSRLNDFSGQPKDPLEWFYKEGVKVIVLFNFWAKYQGGHIPIYPDKLKKFISKAHSKGIKVLLYRSRELSNKDPLWAGWSKKSLIIPTTYGYRRNFPIRQVAYGYCPASKLQGYFIWSADKLMKEYGIDGFYLDGVAGIGGCCNHLHGCGYKDNAGHIHITYPVEQTRRLMLRLYRVVKSYKPDGLIDVHGDGVFTPSYSFATGIYLGEQYYKLRRFDKNPIDILPPKVFRAVFRAYSRGLSSNLLVYPGCPFSDEEGIAISFIHGVSARPHALESPPGKLQLIKTAPIWKALRNFDIDNAEFVPYWKLQPEIVEKIVEPKFLSKSIYISYYRKDGGKNLLVLISNFGVHGARVRIRFKSKVANTNTLLGDCPANIVDTQTINVMVEPFKLVVIEVKLTQPLR